MSGGHIFVSYGRANGVYVKRLVAALRRAGVNAWFDNDIETGDLWKPELQGQVELCRALLLVMTPDAGASAWVAREVALAIEKEKQILPLWLDGDILFDLQSIQAEDVRDGGLPSLDFVQRLAGMAPLHRVTHQIGLVPEAADCFQHRDVADRLQSALALAVLRS